MDQPEVPAVPAHMRVSDHERDAVAESLGEHAAVGRLTLDELEERVSAALAARTRGDLETLQRDLPDKAEVPPRRREAVRWMVAVMGGSHRRGRYRLAGRLNVVAIMGGDHVDLREAELDGGEVTVSVTSIMGGANIYLPDSVEVEVSGMSLMGGDTEFGVQQRPRRGAPLVHIRSYNLMGGSYIYRLPPDARGVPLREARRAAKAAGRRQLRARG
ncbi:MAG: DUF1707 domain-containing protein [Nocardiopsaceae bacterium]|nr:DUF1707 domain-containing protein [Nocardiopsaceae bacterium]